MLVWLGHELPSDRNAFDFIVHFVDLYGRTVEESMKDSKNRVTVGAEIASASTALMRMFVY